MKHLKRKTYILSMLLFCLLFLYGCENVQSIENLAVITGFGYDFDNKEKKEDAKFVSAIEFISIKKKDESGSSSFEGKGDTIYNSIENYKTKQGKPFSYGSELVYLISEERAKEGLEDVAYDLIAHPSININAKMLVCKGKCIDYFSLKLDSGSASEKMADMVEFANEEFFMSNNFTVNDFLCMYYQQGRDLYLPYVEIMENTPVLTGVAVFKNNKFMMKIPIEEAKLINIIRFSGNKGIVNAHSDDKLKYYGIESKNKVKVKVSTENKRLKYDIKLQVSDDFRIDTLHDEEYTKDQIKFLEKKLADQLKKDLDKEIEKVQKVYRIDCFDLSKYALAKYGRDKDYDRPEYFTNAIINVETKVKINSTGRTNKGSTK